MLATGRRYSRALPMVEMLGLDAPLVTASGALIKRPSDHSTLTEPISAASRCAGCWPSSNARATTPCSMATRITRDSTSSVRGSRLNNLNSAEFFALNPDCHHVWPRLMTDPPSGIFAGFAIGSREQMLELHTALNRELPGPALYPRDPQSALSGYMCEIAPQGVTKWAGICRLADEWGIRPRKFAPSATTSTMCR